MLVNVKKRDRSTLMHRGPCMTCEALDIPYGHGDGRGLSGAHVQYGDAWLRQKARIITQRPKPFVFCEYRDQAPESGMVVRFSTYRNQIENVNGVGYYSIEPYLCESCHGELEQARAAWWQRQCDLEAAKRQAELFEKTWRRPARGEFEIEQGEWRFGLVAPTLELRNIRIAWQTSKLFCQGSSPAFVMMMTVDGKLTGKCYRKYEPACSDETQPIPDLEPVEALGDESIDPREIAAANLFARWIQDHLQEDLREVEGFVWDPRNPGGDFYGSMRCCEVIKTKWIDGSIYTALRDYFTFSEITSLLERMGYKLMPNRSRVKQACR